MPIKAKVGARAQFSGIRVRIYTLAALAPESRGSIVLGNMGIFSSFVLALTGTALAFAADNPTPPTATPATAPDSAVSAPAPVLTPPTPAAKKTIAYVIPVRDQIAKPIFYIIRRGLKEAIEQKADVVVLDMKTTGGALDVTFEIMEALEKFPGETIAYINNEALSAGAFISAVTDEIYFAPDGVIGAAAPVSATGKDIDGTMKLKITSYLKARVRAMSEGKGYRGQVISGMIDADSEMKIGDTVIKAKGELLSLTASEAAKTYGEPPQALLAAGTAKDIDTLLAKKFGAGNYEIRQFRVTWSETLAQYLTKFAPVFMGLGLLAVFIEFKTPGFGIFGISGIVLLALVFFGHYVAGLSGHEPAILFGVGLLMLGVELVFFPGLVAPALIGVGCMMISLIWAMADIWPSQPIGFGGEIFVGPALNLGLALVIAVGLAVGLMRFLPRAWFWDRLVLSAAINANSQMAVDSPVSVRRSLVGTEGTAVTDLFPSGEVEIAGRRYQARLALGHLASGTTVVVKSGSDFNLVVEKKLP